MRGTVVGSKDREDKKTMVSLRIGAGDLAKLRLVARRLRARESAVLRYAVKQLLHRLAPLHDTEMAGRHLLPVLLDSTLRLPAHFELDVKRLESIINAGIRDSADEVDWSDIELLALLDMPPAYASSKYLQISGEVVDSACIHQYLREKLLTKFST